MSGTMITGAGIPLFQLITVKSALKLEKLGMKHSRGSVRKTWAVHLGLKPNAKIDAVIAAVEAKIEEAKKAVQPGDIEAI